MQTTRVHLKCPLRRIEPHPRCAATPSRWHCHRPHRGYTPTPRMTSVALKIAFTVLPTVSSSSLAA